MKPLIIGEISDRSYTFSNQISILCSKNFLELPPLESINSEKIVIQSYFSIKICWTDKLHLKKFWFISWLGQKKKKDGLGCRRIKKNNVSGGKEKTMEILHFSVCFVKQGLSGQGGEKDRCAL